MQSLLVVATATSLVASGKTLDGTYTDPMGYVKYTFNSNGKVRMAEQLLFCKCWLSDSFGVGVQGFMVR
jgi:hypothetical protein